LGDGYICIKMTKLGEFRKNRKKGFFDQFPLLIKGWLTHSLLPPPPYLRLPLEGQKCVGMTENRLFFKKKSEFSRFFYFSYIYMKYAFFDDFGDFRLFLFFLKKKQKKQNPQFQFFWELWVYKFLGRVSWCEHCGRNCNCAVVN
jgi:hypothetical protein